MKGLSSQQEFSISGDIRDNVGHTHSFSAEYTTFGDSASSSSTGFSPGPGGKVSEEKERPSYTAIDRGVNITNIPLSSGQNKALDLSNYSSVPVTEIVLHPDKDGTTALEISETSQGRYDRPENLSIGTAFSLKMHSEYEGSADIVFRVEKAWTDSEHKRNSLALYRPLKGWEKVNTTQESQGDVYINYSASVDSFSDLAAAVNSTCSEGPISASNAQTGACRSFSSICQKPEGWKKVKSCQGWDKKREAEKKLQELKSQDVSQETVSAVREKIDEGQYSDAIEQAEQAEKASTQSSSGGSGILVNIFIALIVLAPLGAAAYIGYLYYNRRKLEQEIEELGQQLIEQAEQEGSLRNKEATDKILNAKKALEMNEYGKARENLEKCREETQNKAPLK